MKLEGGRRTGTAQRCSGRGRGLPLLAVAMVGASIVAAVSCSGTGGNTSTSAREGWADPDAGEHIKMKNLDVEVSLDGVIRQKIQADSALLDEDESIVYLREMDLKFFRGETMQGQATSGQGTLWMRPRPVGGIGRNDLLLEDAVKYVSAEGVILVSPKMYFNNETSTLRSHSGFVKQMASAQGDWFIKAEGQVFEIKFDVEDASLQSWKEIGNPLIYKKIEGPVMVP